MNSNVNPFIQLQAQMQSMQLELDQPIRNETTLATDFSSILNNALQTVNAQQQTASLNMNNVDMGKSHDLAGAMLSAEKASLSFAALIQVRNKAVSAYKDVMQMPV